MPSNFRNAISVLPSRNDLGELVDQLISIERDFLEWEKFKNNPNSKRPVLSALAPRRFSSDEEAEAAWVKIQALSAYSKLLQDRNFANALDSFQRTVEPSYSQKALFVAVVVFYINRFRLETEHPELIKQPTGRVRKSAAKAARKLRMLTKQGARLENLQDQATLDAFLARLASEMDKQPEKRPKNDKTRAGRLFVKRLAQDFLGRFGEPLTSVVSSLAVVVGYEPDQSNIDVVVREVRRAHEKKYRNALANALMSYH